MLLLWVKSPKLSVNTCFNIYITFGHSKADGFFKKNPFSHFNFWCLDHLRWGGVGWAEQNIFSLSYFPDKYCRPVWKWKLKKKCKIKKGILQRPVCGWKQRSQEVSRCPPVCPHAASARSKGLLKNLSATNLPVNVQHLQIERIFLTANFRQSNHTIIWRWFWIIFLSDIALEATYLKKSDTPNGRCSKDLKKR